MKRVLTAVLCLVFLISSVSFSSDAHETRRTVRVGYFDYDGFTMPDESGTMTGYACEYLDEIASYTGWNYEYVPGTLEECLYRLSAGEIDLMAGLQSTGERKEQYLFSKYEMGTEYAMLLVDENDDGIHYNDYAAFDGARIGLIRGTYQSGLLSEFAMEHGFFYNTFWYASAAEQTDALREHKVDAILCGSLQRNENLKAVAKFLPMPFYFIASRDDTALMGRLNDAMENIQTTDINFHNKLYNKYYIGNSFGWDAFTKEEADFIASHPVLRVAYPADWNPIVYYNENTRTCDGISAGILKLLSGYSGIRFEFVSATSQSDMIKKVQDGEADLLCGFPLRYSRKMRGEGIYLTKPYYEVPITVAMPSGMSIDDLRRIAVPADCQSLVWYARELYPELEIVPMANTQVCMEAVGKKSVDAVLENTYVLAQYAHESSTLNLEPFLSPRSQLPVSLGIGEEQDPAFRTLFNKLITRLSVENVNEIVVKNTMNGPALHPWLFIRRIILPLIAAVLFVILCILTYSRHKIEQIAFVDPLTGYMNKNRFMILAGRVLGYKEPSDYMAVSLDVDKFKMINNMHGFDTGNRILTEISKIIGRETRAGELFCRESDDRFDMLLCFQDEETVKKRLAALIEQITGIPQKVGETFQFTVSCGAYHLLKKDRDIYRAVEWANLARENAKSYRQNHISWYDDSMKLRVTEEKDIEDRMEQALQDGEFQVYYQPKIRLNGEKPVGAEALVRWVRSNGSVICPDQFIPVFESNGFVLKLDLCVFEQVCLQMRRWIERGITPYPVSVNLSRVHLGETDFHLKYVEILERYAIPPDLIEIELTESTISENIPHMIEVMNTIKKIGFKVSVDDFGSGYSSLNLLKDLSFDYLKLDKGFLNQASDSERGKQVIMGTKFLADRLHMALLAEGVETRQQVEFLRSIGCDLVQGYYFSKPLPAEALERYFGWR